MAFYKLLCVLFVFLVSTSAIRYGDVAEDGYDEDDMALAMELRSLRQQQLRAFECNNLGESCRGIVPCCGTLQCYWPDGYSVKKAGKCVQCVQNGQLCQRDSQCCSSLVCQKDNAYYVDGRCDSPRPAGQECHEDDQCVSKNCLISNWNKLKGKGGVCA